MVTVAVIGQCQCEREEESAIGLSLSAETVETNFWRQNSIQTPIDAQVGAEHGGVEGLCEKLRVDAIRGLPNDPAELARYCRYHAVFLRLDLWLASRKRNPYLKVPFLTHLRVPNTSFIPLVLQIQYQPYPGVMHLFDVIPCSKRT